MNEELLKKMFESYGLSKAGTFEQFKTDMQSPEVQKKFFDKYNMSQKGSFETFQSDLGFTEKKNPNQPQAQVTGDGLQSSGDGSTPTQGGNLDFEYNKERNPAYTLGKKMYSTFRYQLPANLIGASIATKQAPYDLTKAIDKLLPESVSNFMRGSSKIPRPSEDPMFGLRDKEHNKLIKSQLLQAYSLKERGNEADKYLVDSLDKAEDFVDYINWAGAAIGQAMGQIPAAVATKGATAYGQEIGTIYLDGLQKLSEEFSKKEGKLVSPQDIIERGLDDSLYPILFGMGAGALEFVGAKGVTNTFGKKEVMKSFRDRAIGLIKSMGKAGAGESLTEGGQSVLEQIGIGKTAGKSWYETLSNIDPNDIKESMAQGFIGGSGLSGGGSAAQAIIDKAQETKTTKSNEETITEPIQGQAKTTENINTQESSESVGEEVQVETKPQTNETVETNTVPPQPEQQGVGIKQEDAESITRAIQSAVPETKGSQRSVREIKKSQDSALEAYAKETGSFIENVKENLGEKIDGGAEQDVYLSKDGDKVVKVNGLTNHNTWEEFWDRINLQNELFPNTGYKLIGFTREGGRLSAVSEQPYIDGDPVQRTELIEDLAKRGFHQVHPEGSPGQNIFYNEELGVRISDVHEENVIKDQDGNIRYIDPMLDRDNPFVDEESKSNFNKAKAENEKLTEPTGETVGEGLESSPEVAQEKALPLQGEQKEQGAIKSEPSIDAEFEKQRDALAPTLIAKFQEIGDKARALRTKTGSIRKGKEAELNDARKEFELIRKEWNDKIAVLKPSAQITKSQFDKANENTLFSKILNESGEIKIFDKTDAQESYNELIDNKKILFERGFYGNPQGAKAQAIFEGEIEEINKTAKSAGISTASLEVDENGTITDNSLSSGIAEANKIAQEKGFDSASHLLNSVSKRTGKTFERVQDIPMEVIDGVVNERNSPPSPPVTPTQPETNEGGGEKLSVLERTNEKTSELVSQVFDGTYDPESNIETDQKTQEFINKMGGIENAYEARNMVHPSVRRMLFAEYTQHLQESMDKDPANINKYVDAMIELAVLAKNEGQATQIMDYIYRKYGSMFTYESQILQYAGGDQSKVNEVPDEIRRKFKELSDEHKVLLEEVARLHKEAQEREDNVAIYNIQQSLKREGNIRKQRAEQNKKEAVAERDKLFKELYNLSRSGKLHAEIIPATAIAYGIRIANTYLKETIASLEIVIEKTKELYKKATGQSLTDDQVEAIRKAIEPDFEFGNIKIPASLLKTLVSQGYDTIEKLSAKVQEILKPQHPNITERQARDIISGYGRMVNPSKDELESAVRKIKSAGQFLSKYEDLISGKRPKKTGFQKDKPTAEERGKIRLINNLLKKLPIDNATEESNLRTALDTKKQRLKNILEELNASIQSGTERVKPEGRIITDKETEDLEQSVKDAKAVYDAVFDDGNASSAIDKTINALEKAIDNALARMNHIKDEIYKSEKDKVSNQDIEILKDRLKRISQFREAYLEELGIAELDRLDHLVSNAEKTKERLENKLKTGDFSRRQVKPNYVNYNVASDKAELEVQKEKLKVAPKEQRDEIKFNIDVLEKRIDSVEKLTKKRAEMQNVRDEFTKEQYANELKNMKSEEKVMNFILDVFFNFARGLKAGFDASVVMIQGGIPTMRYLRQDLTELAKMVVPKRFGGKDFSLKDYNSITAKNFKSLFNALSSESKFKKQSAEMSQSEMYDLAKDMGVRISLTDPKLQAKEESVMFSFFNKVFSGLHKAVGKAVGKIPGLGKVGEKIEESNIPRGFERAAHDYLGLVRLQRFSELALKLKHEGKNPIENKEEYKKAAKYVNDSTGAASLGALEAIASKLPYVFFSARLISQALKYTSPYAFIHYYKLGNSSQSFSERINPLQASAAQKAYMQDFVYAIGMQYAIMQSFIALANTLIDDDDEKWSIEYDPRSSAFGQIRIPGEDGRVTYVEPWGPYRTMLVFMSRMISGKIVRRDGTENMLGAKSNLIDKQGNLKKVSSPSRYELMVDFGSNKLAPTPAFVKDYFDLRYNQDFYGGTYEMTDKYGNAVEFDKEVASLAVPMYASTITETFKNQNPFLAAGLSALAFFGMSVNTYDERPKFEREQEELLDKEKRGKI